MDATTITHKLHSAMCTLCALRAHTESQCKTSTNTHQYIKEKINHLNTLKYKKLNEKHKCTQVLKV